MGGRIWRTRPSTRWIWTRARWWPSRCKVPTREIPRRWSTRWPRRGSKWPSRLGVRPGRGGESNPKVHLQGIEELVTDKGYHSGPAVVRVKGYAVRSYIPEKKQQGRRHWKDKREQQQAVYENRRRVRGKYGRSLLRRRGELIERSFAHCYQTGGLRRCHLRGRENILKRQLIHVGAFNLSLILRKL